ncbi:Adaptive-response sensory-kinase SasA [Candidatus Magnetaquicoccaceae bacterium FCR-1]|uniref:histidine kinase n=1 Tax=Candidatus Magnetaquiglobus chichijimensis TaxID=3141448 RepID=A0ABQ0C9Y0_9PROT
MDPSPPHPEKPPTAPPLAWLRAHGLILLVALLGGIFSLFLFLSVRLQITHHLRQEFAWVAQDRHRAVQKSLESATIALHELHDLIQSAPEVNESTFQRLATLIRGRHPGIESLQWITLTPARNDQPEAARVTHLEPFSFPLFSRGHDHYADPLQRSWLEEARDSGAMVVSQRIALTPGDPNRFGFLAALPVYRSDVRALSVLERHAFLSGYILGVFQFATLAEQAIALLEPRGVECIILDDRAPPEARFLHFYASRLIGAPFSFADPHDWKAWIERPNPKLTATNRFGNRDWSITCSQTDHFRSAEWFVHGDWVVFLAGLLLTSLLVHHLWRINRELILRTRMARRLEKSERLLSILFYRSPDTIRLVDRLGNPLLINRTRAVIDNDASDPLVVQPEGFQELYRHTLEQAFAMNEVRHLHHRAGHDRWFEIRVVPLREETGAPTAMVVTTDISVIKLLEEQAAKNARLAALGLMAAGVAHEINNPNNSIYYNASMLADAWPTVKSILDDYHREQGDFVISGLSYAEMGEKIPKIIGWILDNTERIKKIVEALKNLSRDESTTVRHPVDLAELARGALVLLNTTIQSHTERFTHHFPENLPPVSGHPQQLEQVLINILVNALQSLPDRGHGVHLEAVHDETNRQVILIVRDQGCGIPPAVLEKITEPFFTTRLEKGGTGLGLSISASIVKNHGGRLRFESRPDQGTTVFVHLPCHGDLA